MNKLLALILVFTVVLTFTSCSSDNTVSGNESSNPIVILPDNETKETVNGYKVLTSSSVVQSSDASSDVNSSSNAQPSGVSSDPPSSNSSNNYNSTSYVGSKNTKKFHYSTCRYVKKIKESNAVVFETSLAATESGYVPCSVCNP